MKLTTIIPTYNRAHCIARAINSVLAQTRSSDEIIVVDDGSTDDTEKILAGFGDKVKVITQKNSGVSVARNRGVEAANSDLVAFLDSDDVWSPDKLSTQVPLMEDKLVVFSASNWCVENEAVETAFDILFTEKKLVQLKEPLHFLTRFEGHRLLLSTWVVRRDVFLKVGGFDERMSISEDNRLLFRLAFEGEFMLTPYVGTIYSLQEDDCKLTQVADYNYRTRVVSLTTEFLSETYLRAYNEPRAIQCRIRKLFAYYLKSSAVLASIEGKAWLARRRAIECLVLVPRFKDAFISIIILFSPALIAYREKLNEPKI